jgi:hypothetical protein
MGLVDGEYFKGTDLDTDLISVKNGIEIKILFNSEKGLTRYQFIEMFFRIANDKYIRSNIVGGYAEAINKIM